MNLRNRHSTLLLSAAAVAVAVIGSAEASAWLPSGLLSRLTGDQPPAATAAPAGPAADDNASPRLVANGRYRDGSFTGSAYNTYYGPVQVQVTIQGGRVVAVDVPQYPADRRASQRINSRALPMLESEVISAQSARVNIISGATLTSEAYLRSLDSALGNAGSGAAGTGAAGTGI
jgi:uncharacterized protein with FMN-binding domain